MKRAFIVMLLLCAVLLLATTAVAQTATTGQIAGTVKDPTGAVVAGAKLQLTSASGQQREAVADAAGYYRFPLLTPGAYSLTGEATGFKSTTVQNVTVTVTQTTMVDLPLSLEAAKETVNISAEPPLVDTANATTGRLVAERQIKQLPLPTRNLQQLLALSPGTVGSSTNNTEMGRGDVNISVNGQRMTSNNVVMDGVDIDSPGTNSTPNISVPSPDAVQEFIVQTSLYDATQGRNSGGNVALVTKSGTSQFHGSAFEFFRNRQLNANDYFLKKAGIPKPILNRNQFGGTLGGPIIKDKTFFFVSYQGTRERNGASLSNSLSFPFLPAGLTSDRSDAAIASLATAYGALFVNPITKKMLQTKLPNGNYMIPNAAGGSIAAPGLVSSPQSVISRFREDQFNANIDQAIGQKNKLSGKFFFSNTPQYQGIWNFIGSNALQLPGFGGDIEFYNRVLSVTDSHIFSPNLINQARFGYSRIDGPGKPEEPFKNSDFGITNPLCATNPKFCALATVQVSSMFTVGNYPLSDQRSTTQTYEWGDMVSYTHGRHFLRFGADMRRYLVDFYFNFWSNGQVNFSSFKNFMMGIPDFALLGNGVRDRNYRMTDFETYIQDDIRVTDQLTLNVGLRLSRNGGISDTQNRLVNFDPAAFAQNTLPCTAAAPCTKGFEQVNGTLNPNDWNLAPRFGFAVRPSQSSKLVVRGGAGVYFDRPSSRLGNLQIFSYPMDVVGLSLPLPTNLTTFLSSPFPDLSNVKFPVSPATAPSPIPYYSGGVPLGALGLWTPISGIYADKNLRTPYVYQYNLGVQYELAQNLLLETGYVGSRGVKLLNVYSFSQGITGTAPYTTANGFSNQKILNGFQQARTDANSIYNSWQTSLTKRFSHGLQFLASYTWSKSIDDVSGAATNEFVALPGDQQNPASNRAVSDFDRRHRFVISAVYDLPKFYQGSSKFAQGVLNRWETSGLLNWQSGAPFTVACQSGNTTYNRADFLPGSVTPPASDGSLMERVNTGWINPSAFSATCANAAPYGTSPRNFLTGPRQRNIDLSLVKFIPVTERTTLEFRTEFFNAFNLVNFANPISTFTSGVPTSFATLGKITSTSNGPRVIQFALKLSF
jgi:hypothetical protein